MILPPSYLTRDSRMGVIALPLSLHVKTMAALLGGGWHSLASQFLVRSEVALAVPRVRGLQLPASSLSPFHPWNAIDHVISDRFGNFHPYRTRIPARIATILIPVEPLSSWNSRPSGL
ncbi:hypothetical protein BS47DRAFT_1157393 [Hydnum rufescens UP504]|uniref:Uncharacterized protein n=1 Tax=Hydnum rufescens UP504 TaxID=1448309 RepID=A0A9P6B8U4_9AGAM|nr:hypothetical protein BS47DRAFT_1157393 [Hydnum rufescens UP504]